MKKCVRCMAVGNYTTCCVCERVCGEEHIVCTDAGGGEYCPRCFILRVLGDKDREIRGKEHFDSPQEFVDMYMRDI